MMPINKKPKQEDPQIQAIIDEYKEQLQTTSAPSDKWIESAGVLMGKFHYKYEEIALFDTEQLENILNAYQNGDFTQEQLATIMDVNLNATQMSVILMGYANGGTVEQLEPYYSNSDIPYLKMNYMVTALVQHGVDMMPYMEYDTHQIYEIFAGIVQGLDYKRYAKIYYPAEIMGLIRHALSLENITLNCDEDSVTVEFIPANTPQGTSEHEELRDFELEDLDLYEDPDESPAF